MLTTIISRMICEEFEQNPAFKSVYRTSPTNAMKVTFSLNRDFNVEDGYRDLDILIFGGGSNYIKVYARLRWNVVANEGVDVTGNTLLDGYGYVEGATPWRLYSDHDSGWRTDGVEGIIWTFRDRLSAIGTGFSRWYTVESLSPEEVKWFMNGRARREHDGFSKEIQEDEFKFPTKAEKG
jgi:hypothetical protein